MCVCVWGGGGGGGGGLTCVYLMESKLTVVKISLYLHRLNDPLGGKVQIYLLVLLK